MTETILKHWKKENNPYNWEQGCSKCGGKFREDEEFIRVDTETNEFRGDDEVKCFHKGECFHKRNQ